MLHFDGISILDFFMSAVIVIVFVVGLLTRQYAKELDKENEANGKTVCHAPSPEVTFTRPIWPRKKQRERTIRAHCSGGRYITGASRSASECLSSRLSRGLGQTSTNGLFAHAVSWISV